MANSDITFQPFKFNGNIVRIVNQNGKLWFVNRDVCGCIEQANPQLAVRLLNPDEKGVLLIGHNGGSQDMAVVNERGLNSLISNSRKPAAKAFKRWLTSVLPSIRETDGYIHTILGITDKDILAHGFVVAMETIKKMASKVQCLEQEQVVLDSQGRSL